MFRSSERGQTTRRVWPPHRPRRRGRHRGPAVPRAGGARPVQRHRQHHPASTRHAGTVKAQALVEFAIVLPILLMLVVGCAGLGLLLIGRMQLQAAANEAAVAGAQASCTVALSRVPELLGHTPQEASCDVGGGITAVTLGDPFPVLVPGLPGTSASPAAPSIAWDRARHDADLRGSPHLLRAVHGTRRAHRERHRALPAHLRPPRRPDLPRLRHPRLHAPSLEQEAR